MTAIVDQLDAWTNQEYSGLTRKLFGYCELARKTSGSTEQPMPMKIANRSSERTQVSLDDKYKLITWVRLPGTISQGNEVEGNEWGFGLSQGVVQNAQLRWIVAHRVELGEDWIHTFLKEIPITLNVDGYELVSINKDSNSVDADHENIYRTELGDTVYEKHRFTWNLYAITLNVQYVLCEN
jgi:hypothetical protein